jgi:predicted glutamine amidotransferase
LCIAAVSLKGGFTEQELRAFFINNKDGGGFSYVEHGAVQNIRHITDIEDYVKTGEALKKYDNLVTHCRIATCGSVKTENAHPFPLMGTRASMVHNGSFASVADNDYSDTRVVAERGQQLLGNEELMTPEMVKKVEKAIGSYNKVIILYNSGKRVILNEDKGTWENQKWYSNTYWKHTYSNIMAEYNLINKAIAEGGL